MKILNTSNQLKPAHKPVKTILTILIALTWIINGLFCKLLNLVPRHQEIVARILGHQHAYFLTKLIGVSEVIIGVWVLSKIMPRYCAILQIVMIAVMNAIEFCQAPDLLLFGKFNAILALVLITVIYYHEFILGRKINHT